MVGNSKSYFSRYNVIAILSSICQANSKDKIIRLCVATWRNYIAFGESFYFSAFAGLRILEYLQTLDVKSIGDQEMQDDVNFIVDRLGPFFISMNSFEEYLSELRSGQLQWSPAHRSTYFWKDNVGNMVSNHYQVLMQLCGYLEPQLDAKTLAIATHDVGMFVSTALNGPAIIDSIGAKAKIMLLISHENAEVRFQALNAMQKYMKKLWNCN